MTGAVALFMRHGDYHQKANTPSAHQPYGLTDRGLEQARDGAAAVRKMLTEQGWTLAPVMYCSGLLRAWETAEAVRLTLDLQTPVIADDALNERSVGTSAANLTLQEIETLLDQDPRYGSPPADWKSSSTYQLPLSGAESLMKAGQRVARFVQDILHKPDHAAPGTATLFIGHGAAFRHAAHLLGVLEFEQIAKLSMFHAQPVALSVAQPHWKHCGGGWKIRTATGARPD